MEEGAGIGLVGVVGAIVTISVGVPEELEPPQDANKNEVQNNTPSEGSEDEITEAVKNFSELYDTDIAKFPNKTCHTIIITSLCFLSSTKLEIYT